MNKKIFIVIAIPFLLFVFLIYLFLPKISFYNVEFIQPLFWTLLPLIVLLFLLSFLKSIKTKQALILIAIFLIIDFFILFQIDTTCSQIICFGRNLSALLLSSLFSMIYFIIQFIKNKKQPY